MRYICLAYEEEEKFNALTKSEWVRLRDETMKYLGEMQQSGHILSAEPLQSVRKVVTVRVRSGMVSTTDGPFTETKEQLGGFFLVEAQSLNEAIHIASRWPSARIGSIEVRPIENGLREDGRYL